MPERRFMHDADPQAQLIPIQPELPEADAGAPMPAVGASERGTLLGYYVSFRYQEEHGVDRLVALVRFTVVSRQYLGSPNDEGIHTHPLAASGLGPYEFAEVISSPWIGRPGAGIRHFVLCFHDETFECLARDVEVVGLLPGRPTRIVGDALADRLSA